MKRKGEITVFLVMILSILLIFVSGLISNIKSYLFKCNYLYASEIAMESCFAEYNRRLFERFHILYIDPSYKTLENDEEQIKQHFANYLKCNTGDPSEVYIELNNIKRASDNDWENVVDQILDYTHNRYGYGDDRQGLSRYIMNVFGNKDHPHEGCIRIAEQEYLIYGYESDYDNMTAIMNDYDIALSYDEYIENRLLEMDLGTIKNRIIDLIEEDVTSNGNPGFIMEKCIYGMDISAIVKNSRKEIEITKGYSYENI